MFRNIVIKEMLNSVYDFRFLIALVLCLIFIPLGFYITLSEYEQRLSEHNNSVSMYNERVQGLINQDLPAEGYRPPSPLAVFALGLENHIPNKIITSRDGITRYVNERGINNPVSLLFGEIDFRVNVSIILSLLALIFSYNIFSGEKEQGTLRQIISNSISRTELLLAKITGIFSMLLMPLIISIITAILVIVRMGDFHLIQGEYFPKFITVLIVSILFVFCIFNLGVLVSTWTRRSITSIIILLLIWLMYVIAIPKLSPLIAQIIYPVKSQEVVTVEKQLLMSNLGKELSQKRDILFKNILQEYGVNPNVFRYFSNKKRTANENKALENYEDRRTQLENEYNDFIGNEISKIESNYRNRRNIQITIAMNLSRLSPVSCYNYIVSELSGTGIHEIDNFMAQAYRYQIEVEKEIYDKFKIEHYGIFNILRKPENRSELQVPQLNNYAFLNITQVFQYIWIDLFLIILYIILFFSAAYVSFLRYDVR
jgi:ABC-type transport system involved in multi-copper enzyme maturation permease subunit